MSQALERSEEQLSEMRQRMEVSEKQLSEKGNQVQQ